MAATILNSGFFFTRSSKLSPHSTIYVLNFSILYLIFSLLVLYIFGIMLWKKRENFADLFDDII
jgi:ABC-type transport system involved in multi-copper enzyme maturation permease subunit